MKWNKKEWSLAVALSTVFLGTWLVFGVDAMYRVMGIALAVSGTLCVANGWKSWRSPKKLNEDWAASDDREWGKTLLILGVIQIVGGGVLFFNFPFFF